MATNEESLIKALEKTGNWIEASYLADMLGVTTRTIRNRIKKINNLSSSPIVESSYRGYRLAKSAKQPSKKNTSINDDESRTDQLLRLLISTDEPLVIYDLADEFCISDATIESDLRRVRDSIRLFDLKIIRHRDTVLLQGSEGNKRRLIGCMLATESPVGFATFTGEGIVRGGYDLPWLTGIVTQSLTSQGLHADDYGVNNIVMHLVVTIDRIEKGRTLPKENRRDHVLLDTPGFTAAQLICSRISSKFNISMNDEEIAYFALILSSNSSGKNYSFNSKNQLEDLINQSDIELAQAIVAKLEQVYHLEPFDYEFLTHIAIHLHGILQRVPNGVFAKNPLSNRIKETYPLVYDMAAFFATEITAKTGLSLNEDEVSFLAFHIGAYFDRENPESESVSCAFLYLDYHDLHRQSINRIQTEFGRNLSIDTVMPVTSCNPVELSNELIITPVEINSPHSGRTVIVNPILTNTDMDAIKKATDAILARRRGTQAFGLIKRFLVKSLFHEELYAATKEELIRTIVKTCSSVGFCEENYAKEVLEREVLSPTAFSNRVAMPHSMSASTERSFLSVVINQKPMDWDGQKVNIIMLMGLSEHDRASFRILFDSLIQVLSEPANVTRLIKSKNYEEFSELLNEMIMREQK